MRLIDADALHAEISAWPESLMYRDWVQSAIAKAPTISPPPNDPLTLEELRKMDGEPVWITPGGFWALVIARRGERVRLINHEGEIVWADKEIELVGPVYRRKPEEMEADRER